MAVSLTLTDGTTTYNLLTGALKLRYQGWEMQGPQPEGETTLQGYGASYKFTGYRPLTETFTLYAAAAATEVSIRQAVRDIDKILEQARRWHSYGTEKNTTAIPWLTFSTGTEASARNCLLYGGSVTLLAGNGAQPTLSNNNALALLTLTRHPLWVETPDITIRTPLSVSSCGGATAFLTQAGTAPGLTRLILSAPNGQATPMTKAWVGILPTTNVARTWFNPVLSLSAGTAGTDATSKADPGGNDLGGNTIEVTFATHTDLHARASVALSNIDADGTHWESWTGVFRVLCRYRVDAGTTSVGLQLKWGGPTTPTANLQYAPEIVGTASTVYHFVDLGEITIPLGRLLASYYSDVQLQVWAERFSGAGTLYLDALTLIPAEHMVTLENANIKFDGAAYAAVVQQHYDDETTCEQLTPTFIIESHPNLTARDFFFPCYTGGCAVVAAERAAGSTATDNIEIGLITKQRWAHYKDT